MLDLFSLFVSCPKGLEYLLEDEVKALGLYVERVSPQGVYGHGSLTVIYQLCLWSRLANRVQLVLFSDEAHNQEGIYQLCRQFPWQTIFSVDKTLAIAFHGASTEIRHSMFGAQVVKDGIVDYFRDFCGTRPTVSKDKPDILLHAYLKQDQLSLNLDLAGYSLHQRGYRKQAGLAPIKENVAAALLMRAGWPEKAAAGFALQDPFCGAGTLMIEAAMMVAQIAPGLLREDQSLQHWVQHQAALWEKLRREATEQARPVSISLSGSDPDPQMLSMATANAQRARVAEFIDFQTQDLGQCRPKSPQGLVVGNPPYGERMGDERTLIPLYQQLGQVLHEHYQGWQAAILCSSPLLAKATALRSAKQYSLYNGPIECKLYCFDLNANNTLKTATDKPLSDGAQMLFNRLQKNHAHLGKWAKKNQIDCYRLYDADLPEYSFAIDRYADYFVVQEYKAPNIIPEHKIAQRRLELLQVLPKALSVSSDQLIIKERKQQKGKEQYQKLDQTQHRLSVNEGKVKLLVNLYDYLDTGLFLDHRRLRLKFEQLPAKTNFLNCFCYTGSASVHAAIAGAKTTNIDLSNTYLDWAKANFRLNHLDLAQHQFIQDDVLSCLKKIRDRFDVIFIDPPSFSNSKRMSDDLDVQRDHEALIRAAMHLLYPGGRVYFSCNLRSFKLSPALMDDFKVKDISAETIDLDFKRNSRIHRCFQLELD
jgi:23S rRNA (guanine2445-N2)-methyltransferase / 23S rRNA (guanine2069-N7)-methyltransferase